MVSDNIFDKWKLVMVQRIAVEAFHVYMSWELKLRKYIESMIAKNWLARNVTELRFVPIVFKFQPFISVKSATHTYCK